MVSKGKEFKGRKMVKVREVEKRDKEVRKQEEGEVVCDGRNRSKTDESAKLSQSSSWPGDLQQRHWQVMPIEPESGFYWVLHLNMVELSGLGRVVKGNTFPKWCLQVPHTHISSGVTWK